MSETLQFTVNKVANSNQVVVSFKCITGESLSLLGTVNNVYNLATLAAGGSNPGGTANQIQYNASGNFGGFTMSGDATIVVSTGVITVVSIGGNVVSLGGAFTMSGAFTFTGILTANTNVTFPTSGTLVNSSVTSLSSLATVGTIGTGVWHGTIIGSTYGGTGVNNGSNTLTLSGGSFSVTTNGGTLSFGATSKTLTVNNSLTLSGTDATTMTFPSTSDTLGGLGTTQTWTGINTFNGNILLGASASIGAAGTSASISINSTNIAFLRPDAGSAIFYRNTGFFPAGQDSLGLSASPWGSCYITALSISQTPTAVVSGAAVTITSAADGAGNIGHRIKINFSGTDYWLPASSVAF